MSIRYKLMVFVLLAFLSELTVSAPMSDPVARSGSSDAETQLADRIVGPDPNSSRLWISEFDTTTAAALSGPWYNPEQSGHGFFFTFDKQAVTVSWFTFRDGEPLWLVGSFNDFSDQYLDFELDLYEASGAQFPPFFDSDDVNQQVWGQLKVDVRSCSEIRVEWDPIGSGESPGGMDLRRITPQRGEWCYIHNERKDQAISSEMCAEGPMPLSPRYGQVLEIEKDEVIEVRGDLWGPDDIDYYYIRPRLPRYDAQGELEGVDQLDFDFADVAEIDEYVEVSVINRHSNVASSRSCERQVWMFQQILPVEIYGDFGMPNAKYSLQLPTLNDQLQKPSYTGSVIVALNSWANDGSVDYVFKVGGSGPDVSSQQPPSDGSGVADCVTYTPDPSVAFAGYFESECSDLEYPLNVGFCYTGPEVTQLCTPDGNNGEPGWYGATRINEPFTPRYVSGPSDNYEIYFGVCENGALPFISDSLVNGAPQSYYCQN